MIHILQLQITLFNNRSWQWIRLIDYFHVSIRTNSPFSCFIGTFTNSQEWKTICRQQLQVNICHWVSFSSSGINMEWCRPIGIAVLETMMVSHQCCQNKSWSFPKDVMAYPFPVDCHLFVIRVTGRHPGQVPSLDTSITYSHSNTLGQFRVSSQPNVHVSGLWWEETGVPGENPQSQREHSHFSTQRPGPESNPEPPCQLLDFFFFKWPLCDKQELTW